ncbi:MAG: PD-(D/E)XK nuclease family protein [Oscillospiraceae bacterium]|nr:PD-(D/E)XK nuclease family protein [Oscillospiraceae bacterium]
MLTLLTGKAGSGKTAAVLGRIRENVIKKIPDNILLVPEQYSHEAERELAGICPDSMSLYAEAMSFTGLARRLTTEYGGSAKRYLDEGGKLLAMALALSGFGKELPGLRVFGGSEAKGETQEMLLSTVEELQASGITAEDLLETAGRVDAHLAGKLRELAMICEQYTAVVSKSGAESADRLTDLALLIRDRAAVKGWQVFVDGFSDFTSCETAVLQALLKGGADVTVCLTAESRETQNEVFSLSRATAVRLRGVAEGDQVEVREEYVADEARETADRDPAISALAENAFLYTDRVLFPQPGSIRLYRCRSKYAECEFAAAEALRFVREDGCRWRDVAVAVRGFSDYEPVLKRLFEHYGVPLFVSEKTRLSSRPLPALLAAAYEIASSRWDRENVIAYMRTGITGLSREDCDELETYVFRWKLDERAWRRAGSWKQHPEGSGNAFQAEDSRKLERINRSAIALSAPLWDFIRAAEKCGDAAGHAKILRDLMQALDLPGRMTEICSRLEQEGRLEDSREYRRVWDLTCDALEQCEAVLGNTRMTMEEFGDLFIRMLSKYSYARIPASVDRVSAGDFDRMRRRNIRHLIVLGASDDRLPGGNTGSGVFSETEKEQMIEAGLVLGAGEEEIWREITRIYNCLSLPSASLTLSYASQDADGNALEASLIMKQAERMFGIRIVEPDPEELRLAAVEPAFSMAANADSLNSAPARAAERFFEATAPARLEAVRRAAVMPRGQLTPSVAQKLYGRETTLSASRADTFAGCKFAYFCRYGLRARPYETEELRPNDIGSFMHRIFEQTAISVREEGGFRKITDERLLELADRHIDEYIRTELQDFEEKSARFTFLFRRLREDVREILLDMAEELRKSDFQPLDFELDIRGTEGIEPYRVRCGDRTVTLSGIIDRVDGCEKDGKLYLRVVDYKTGKKKFRLSDVCYGTNLQMLLYLNDLKRTGKKRYGKEPVPAGIMYLPARNDIQQVKREDDPNAEKREREARRRSGLVLDDEQLLEAWENGPDKIFIPMEKKKGGTGETLVSEENLELLAAKVDRTLSEMADSIARGEITADPLYSGESENACVYCDYKNQCGFRDGEHDEVFRRRVNLNAEEVWARLNEELGREHGKEKEHGETESNG